MVRVVASTASLRSEHTSRNARSGCATPSSCKRWHKLGLSILRSAEKTAWVHSFGLTVVARNLDGSMAPRAGRKGVCVHSKCMNVYQRLQTNTQSAVGKGFAWWTDSGSWCSFIFFHIKDIRPRKYRGVMGWTVQSQTLYVTGVSLSDLSRPSGSCMDAPCAMRQCAHGPLQQSPLYVKCLFNLGSQRLTHVSGPSERVHIAMARELAHGASRTVRGTIQAK